VRACTTPGAVHDAEAPAAGAGPVISLRLFPDKPHTRPASQAWSDFHPCRNFAEAT
jgi:hypothetical protein